MKFSKGFESEYLTDLIEKIGGLQLDSRLRAPTNFEIIRPMMFLEENKKLKYIGLSIKSDKKDPRITDPFKIMVVIPEEYYERLKTKLEGSIDKKIRDSSMLKFKKGNVLLEDPYIKGRMYISD